MSLLFEPLVLGDLTLPNRVIMAPLTRMHASPGRVPNALMAEYYTQRVGAGLILSEATAVTPQGVGYADTPGLWTPEQVQGWRQVTAAVHAAGGRIFAQLWHVGRISDPMFLDGQLPVAPSALAARGHVSHVRPQRAYVTPRALETAELPGVIQAYRLGAQMAQEAGFDGVEVHAANGYLLDQFLQDSTNLRNDDYGGPVENRARLLLEATDACVGVWGAAAWACTCRRAAISIPWAIRTAPAPSATWRPNSAGAASRSCACASMRRPTASAPRSRRPLAAPTSPTKALRVSPPRPRSPPAAPTRWHSACSTSPIRTWRGVSR